MERASNHKRCNYDIILEIRMEKIVVKLLNYESIARYLLIELIKHQSQLNRTKKITQ